MSRLLPKNSRNPLAFMLIGCLFPACVTLHARPGQRTAPSAPARPAEAPPPRRQAGNILLCWPTPNPAFFEGRPLEAIIQPTQSGAITSGTFGCVRENGRRFHEGIDIRSIAHDRRHEATDSIYAALSGVVSYINSVAGRSSYGRYIVIEHPELSPAVYTLYAHLSAIEPGIRPGLRIEAGQRLGTMGRSAMGHHGFPRERSHLHFEIGVRMTDLFPSWYAWKKFPERNPHGNYNGMNFTGMDPLEFFTKARSGQFRDMQSHVRGLETAFRMRIITRTLPDFVRRYPALVDGEWQGRAIGGWEVDFTWYGLPKRWRAIPQGAPETVGKDGDVQFLDWNTPLLKEQRGRQVVIFDRKGQPRIGKTLATKLQLLFGFRKLPGVK